MKKYLLILSMAFGSFLLASSPDTVQAASCCPVSGNCTITTSPCDLGGPYLNGIRTFNINVATANPVQINLTANTSMSYTSMNFENSGGNKNVIITGPGRSFSITTNNATFPSGSFTVNTSAAPTSTANGGAVGISINGPATFPFGAGFYFYTYASNASNNLTLPLPEGGGFTVNWNGEMRLSSNTLIQTGITTGNPTDGGDIFINMNGPGGIIAPSTSFITSSTNNAGNITVQTNGGDIKAGAHANGGVKGGVIYFHPTNSGSYYAPVCLDTPSFLEAKNGGTINIDASGSADIFGSTATRTGGVGLGTLSVRASSLSDPTCKNAGSPCNNELLYNNNTVTFNCVFGCPASPKPKCYASNPEVVDVTSSTPNGFYTTGAVIKVDVIFDGPVKVTGSPTLQLETGSIDRLAAYSSGDSDLNNGKVTFTYNVLAGDYSPDLDYLTTASLTLNGGTIKNYNNTNDAYLNLPAPGALHSLSANKDIVIDTESPSVIVTAMDKNNNLISNGGNITTGNATTVKFLSVGWDNVGIYTNTVSWSTDNWVTTNQVNCGNVANCWVRIDSTPISFSTNGAIWTSCGTAGAPNPACTISNWVGPFGNGTVKYKAQVSDAALNSGATGNLSFSISASNTPPVVTLNAVNPPAGFYCSNPPQAINFSWNFSDAEDGVIQTAYQLRVIRDGSWVYDSGKKVSSNTSIPGGAINAEAGYSGFVDYNHSYSWEVTVWDSSDASDGPKTGNNFSTPTHAYPTANFTYLPLNPAVDQVITFTDTSTAFGGASIVQRDWDFQNDGVNDASGSPVTHQYPAPPQIYSVKLTVKDSNEFQCSIVKPVNVGTAALPKWKEVVPR